MEQKNNMKVLAKKIRQNKAKSKKDKAKKFKKVKIGLIVVLFIILIGLMVKGIDLGVKFFRENTFVFTSPITMKFNKPVELVSLAELQRREQEEIVLTDIADEVLKEYLQPKSGVDIKNECQITSQINPKTFFDIIAVKESGNNKNDNPRALHNFCKAKGMYNAIGYSPTTKFCFKDEQEARLFVAYYVKKNCDGKTMESCLCFYNEGKWLDSCPYSEGNLSMAN